MGHGLTAETMEVWKALIFVAFLALAQAKSTSKADNELYREYFFVAIPDSVYFQVARILEQNIGKLTQDVYQEVELLMWDHLEILTEEDKTIYNPDADPDAIYITLPFWVYQQIETQLKGCIGSFTLQDYRMIQLLVWHHVEFLEPTLFNELNEFNFLDFLEDIKKQARSVN